MSPPTQPMPNRRTAVTRTTIRFLTVGLLLGAVSPRAPGQTEQDADRAPLNSADLSRRFSMSYAVGDWKTAIDAAEKWVRIKPRDPTAAYNLACAYALDHQTDNALEWLEKAVDRGFDQTRHIASDSDLDSLRDTDRYRTIFEKAKKSEYARFQKSAAIKPVVIEPRSLDPQKPVPLIIALHGFGGRPENLAEIWRQPAEELGAFVILPRGPVRAGIGGARWTDEDETEFIVNHYLEWASKQHTIDPDRVVLFGFSQGAWMALNVAVRQSNTFSGVVLSATGYHPAVLPEKIYDPKSWPRFVILVGGQDRSLAASRRADQDLRSRGLTCRLNVYPEIGHQLPRNANKVLVDAVRFSWGHPVTWGESPERD